MYVKYVWVRRDCQEPAEKGMAGDHCRRPSEGASRSGRYGAGFSVALPVGQYFIEMIKPEGSGVGVQAPLAAL